MRAPSKQIDARVMSFIPLGEKINVKTNMSVLFTSTPHVQHADFAIARESRHNLLYNSASDVIQTWQRVSNGEGGADAELILRTFYTI